MERGSPGASRRRFVGAAAPDGPGCTDGGARLRVLQYNMLSQRHCERDNFAAFANEFTGVPAACLSWAARCALLKEELLGSGADVLLLQEAEVASGWSADLYPELQRGGYSATLDASEGGAVPVVCWREAELELAAVRHLRFAEAAAAEPPEGRLLPPAAAAGTLLQDLARLSRGAGATLALLRRRAPPGGAAVVCSAHLSWDFAHQDIKTAQAAMLCSALQGLAAEHQGAGEAPLPVILGGDFNSIPADGESRFFKAFAGVRPAVPGRESFGGEWRRHGGERCAGVYRLLAGGELPPAHPEHPAAAGRCPALGALSHALRLRSAYREGRGRDPESTNRCGAGPWWSGCLDYIWTGSAGGGPAEPPAVLELLELPYDTIQGGAARFGPIPNAGYPSDHLALGATLALPAPR
eukprot:TRINITY_DN26543_c0_g1_i1.p1 TRINITY_DN26543_c0_g1~~TRINITY_DN26543_c0_g1_i1.p1  ORF type:complete len:435 (+),score=117.71 TRINITY_DN26543_c0_g1_i1:75-1307(+)